MPGEMTGKTSQNPQFSPVLKYLINIKNFNLLPKLSIAFNLNL
jgi:hypothetical protein